MKASMIYKTIYQNNNLIVKVLYKDEKPSDVRIGYVSFKAPYRWNGSMCQQRFSLNKDNGSYIFISDMPYNKADQFMLDFPDAYNAIRDYLYQ